MEKTLSYFKKKYIIKEKDYVIHKMKRIIEKVKKKKGFKIKNFHCDENIKMLLQGSWRNITTMGEGEGTDLLRKYR